MKNLKILNFNIEGVNNIFRKTKNIEKANYLTEFVKERDYDVIALHESNYDINQELSKSLKDYFHYALIRGANKTDWKNIVFLKKELEVINQRIYTLSDSIHLPNSKAKGSFYSNTCNVIKLKSGNNYVTLFNTQLDKFSKVGRNYELKQLDYLFNLLNYDGDKVITIDSVADINKPFLEFITNNNLKMPTLKLGSSIVDENNNSTTNILTTSTFDVENVNKYALVNGSKVLSNHYMTDAKLIYQKKL